MTARPQISLHKYQAGQKDARGRIVESTTIRVTIRNPGEIETLLIDLGYTPEANANGKTGALEYYARGAAELDRVRSPLRGLVI